MRRATLMLAAVTAALALGLGGCATAAPGVTNQAGNFIAAFEASPAQVAAAARAVVEELELKLVSYQATALDGMVEAATAQDKDVTIKINREGDKASRVSVRVGLLGDRELSVLILEKIKARL